MNARSLRRKARPQVTLEAYADVYRYFGPGRRRNAFTHPLLWCARLVSAPRVVVSDPVVTRIRELFEAGTGVVVAVNHPSAHDALTLPSAMWDKRIRFLATGTGLAKDSLFSGITRPLVEYTGAIPVFRAKDYPEVPAEVQVAASVRMTEVCSDQLRDGGALLSFVEGTNSSPDDLRALRPDSIKRGIGLIVHGALASGRPVALLPVGISYRGREHAILPPRGAVVRIGEPVLWEAPGPLPTVDEIRHTARESINSALADAWND